MTGFLAKGHNSMALLAPCILNLGCKPLSHSLDYTVFFEWHVYGGYVRDFFQAGSGLLFRR